MIALDLLERALLAPCMESVIAVTERYQFLNEHQGARVYTAYREVDHTLCIGFSKKFDHVDRQSLDARGFVLFGDREGTVREHRLLLLTLDEIGFTAIYGQNYFTASCELVRNLNNLGWPLGELKSLAVQPRGCKDSAPKLF